MTRRLGDHLCASHHEVLSTAIMDSVGAVVTLCPGVVGIAQSGSNVESRFRWTIERSPAAVRNCGRRQGTSG